jgi:hypothetical protein
MTAIAEWIVSSLEDMNPEDLTTFEKQALRRARFQLALENQMVSDALKKFMEKYPEYELFMHRQHKEKEISKDPETS